MWSQRDEWRVEYRQRAIDQLKRTSAEKMTKPQRIVNDLLSKLNICFQNEYNCKYYSIDNYLIDSELMIEVMGDFWHCSPIKYTIEEAREIQKKSIPKDKKKHDYIQKMFGIEILYLWEDDIYNNLYLCEMLRCCTNAF